MAWSLLIAVSVTLVLGGCGADVKNPATVVTMEKGGEFRSDFYQMSPDTAGSRFYSTLTSAPEMDGQCSAR